VTADEGLDWASVAEPVAANARAKRISVGGFKVDEDLKQEAGKS
jgi:hypothetical protein